MLMLEIRIIILRVRIKIYYYHMLEMHLEALLLTNTTNYHSTIIRKILKLFNGKEMLYCNLCSMTMCDLYCVHC